MATKEVVKETNEQTKIKELEKTIEDLNAMVKMLVSNSALNTQVQKGSFVEEDVTIISLCNNTLNLSTEANGEGTIYTFTEFGERQSIPYSDVKRIIRNNKKFIQGGKCYIEDANIVKAEHLDKYYKQLLNDEQIENLLELDRNKFYESFDKMTPIQQNIFKEMAMDKLSKQKTSVDMNIVQYINDKFNTNILEDIKYSEEIMNNKG